MLGYRLDMRSTHLFIMVYSIKTEILT